MLCERKDCPWNNTPGAINYTPCRVCGHELIDHGFINGPQTKLILPEDAKERKAIPLATGCLDYFPDALAAVAEVSFAGNQQHNPGEPLHWAREKSKDHPDCLLRHFVERGTFDKDKMLHSAKVAWRALAILQLEIEALRKP